MSQQPDIARIAAAHGLGAPVATYPARRLRRRHLGGLVLLAVLLLGLDAVFALPGPARGRPVIVVVTAAWWGLVVILLRTPNLSRAQARRAAYVFEHGLVHVDRSGTPDGYRWDAIMSVTQRIVRRKTFESYLYTVTRNDGTVLTLTEFYDGIAELGRTVCERVAGVHLPHAYAAIERGETVPFGDLALNAAGVVSVRHGVLPWAQLDCVAVTGGYVRLRRTGRWLPWSTKPAGEIPNLYVFLTLLDRLRSRVSR
jgi:hypothetical protein